MSCPLCGSDSVQTIFSDINRREGLPISSSLSECLSCGMHHLNPAPDGKWLAELYRSGMVDPVKEDPALLSPSSRYTVESSGFLSIVRRVNRLFRGRPHSWPDEDGKGRSILDFGCHDGIKLEHWYQRGWQVAGVDLNESAIAVARQRFPDGRFWCGDLLKLEIPNRFDVIRSDNVVEHLNDPVAYLAELAKHLKPGGFLRVFVPNGAALSVLLFGRYSYIYWMPFHLSFFTTKTLRIALERAGLNNIGCSTYNPIGSWMHTQRQVLLRPGYDRRPASLLDRMIRNAWLLNYLGETIAQWLGLGEEVVGTGQLTRGCIESETPAIKTRFRG